MSLSETSRLVTAMSADLSFARDVLIGGDPSAIAMRAAAAGYDITLAEAAALQPPSSRVLSDAELDGVSGGGLFQDIDNIWHDGENLVGGAWNGLEDALGPEFEAAKGVFESAKTLWNKL